MTRHERHIDFHNYHDYYSKTYPRYQGYSERENKQDLIDLINIMYDNKKIEFEYELYETPEGDINPRFRDNVRRSISAEMLSGDLCGLVQDITYQTVSDPRVISSVADKIDIDKIAGNQDQISEGNNPIDADIQETIFGFVDGDV